MSRKKTLTVAASALALGALLATGVSGVAMAANGDASASTSAPTKQAMHGKKDAAGALSNRDDKGGKGAGRGGSHGMGRGHALHSTATIKDSTGAFVNIASIQGAVTAVSATSITVKAEDGFTATYVVNANTKVHTDAKKDGTIADVAVGQTAEVRGTSAGSTATADHVHVKAAAGSTN